MAPRLHLLLPTICLLGACANAAEEQAAALRLALETGRAGFGIATPAMPAAVSLLPTDTGAPIPIPAVLATATPGPAAADQLLGLGPELLRRWLGEPSLRRAEGGAEVWLYAGTACALDLVLYPDRGRLRVAHASARANGTEPRTEAGCLQDLTARGRPPRPSHDRGA
jgi:hypothetical protein